MTLKAAKLILKPLGVTITRKVSTSEYRVNLLGGKEETAYYTDSLIDVIGTGRMMSWNHSNRLRFVKAWKPVLNADYMHADLECTCPEGSDPIQGHCVGCPFHRD
jgi:hypothetical protein